MQKERILVVDDEEDLCEILQFNLEQAGYVVDTAYSAEEVIEKRLYDGRNIWFQTSNASKKT